MHDDGQHVLAKNQINDKFEALQNLVLHEDKKADAQLVVLSSHDMLHMLSGVEKEVTADGEDEEGGTAECDGGRDEFLDPDADEDDVTAEADYRDAWLKTSTKKGTVGGGSGSGSSSHHVGKSPSSKLGKPSTGPSSIKAIAGPAMPSIKSSPAPGTASLAATPSPGQQGSNRALCDVTAVSDGRNRRHLQNALSKQEAIGTELEPLLDWSSLVDKDNILGRSPKFKEELRVIDQKIKCAN